MVLILLAFAAVEPRVISVANLRNIAVQASYLSVFALAQCLVILTRGFDLSLGFAVSLVSVVSAMAMVASGSAALGIAAGLGVGLADRAGERRADRRHRAEPACHHIGHGQHRHGAGLDA
jgi:ribose transport system permease protein